MFGLGLNLKPRLVGGGTPPTLLAIGANTKAYYGDAGNTVADVSTVPLTTTANSIILFCVVSNGRSTQTFQDSKSNSWVQIGTSIQPSFYIDVYKSTTNFRGTNHTFQYTQGSGFPSIFIVEILGNSPSVDVNAENLDTSSPFQSSTINTTANDEILIALVSSDDGTSMPYTLTNWGDGFTNLLDYDRNTGYQGAIGYKVVASTGAYKASMTPVAGVTQVGFIIAGIKDN